MHVHLYRNNPALVMNFVARELDPVLVRPHDHLERVSRAKFTRHVDAELQKIPAALAGLQRPGNIKHSPPTARARGINNPQPTAAAFTHTTHLCGAVLADRLVTVYRIAPQHVCEDVVRFLILGSA